MKLANAFFAFLFAVVLTCATAAQAQFYDISQILMETECVGGGSNTVMLTVDVNIVTELPPEAVGWVIERTVLGFCWPAVDLGEVQPFPAERTTYVLYDEPDLIGFNTIYKSYAVMESGERAQISQAYRTHWAQADCAGGPAARGMLVEESPGNYYLQVCPDECWWELSHFDGSLPPGATPEVGQTINVYGKIMGGMEGPYIDATSWEASPIPCFAVPADGTDWSGLKARFR